MGTLLYYFYKMDSIVASSCNHLRLYDDGHLFVFS